MGIKVVKSHDSGNSNKLYIGARRGKQQLDLFCLNNMSL